MFFQNTTIAPLIILSAATAFAAGPTVSLQEATLRLPPGASDGIVVLKLNVSGVTEPLEAKALQLQDATTQPAVGLVTFSCEKTMRQEPDQGVLCKALVEGLPLGSTQPRTLKVAGAGVEATLKYVLTNQAAAPFAWNLIPPPDPWVIDGHSASTTLAVVNGETAVNGIRGVRSTLVHEDSKRVLDKVRLCDSGCAKDCPPPGFIEAREPRSFTVCVDGVEPGTYRGKIHLALTEKPDGAEIPLTIHASSWWRHAFGFIALLLGVLLAGLVKVLGPARMARNLAALPALHLAESARMLAREIASHSEAVQPPLATLKRALSTLVASLDLDELDLAGYLPPRWPNPMAKAPKTAEYAQFIAGAAGRLGVLTELTRGVARALALGGVTPEAVLKALEEIALLAEEEPPLDAASARARVNAIVAAMKPSRELAGESARGGALTVESALLEIQTLNILSWIVTVVLTTLAGFVVLVLNDPGFGQTIDFIYCIFWGFGIPTVVQQLKPDSAATAVGYSFQKPAGA